MARTWAALFALGTVIAGASAMLAAGAQDRPGIPTKARVWVENRTPEEAVPVTVVSGAAGTPWRVDVVNVPTVALSATSVVASRSVRQAWEYRSLIVAAGVDPAVPLAPLGQDGWEATGIQLAAQGGALILLRRVR
jgi:hypothetical protein